MNLHKHQLYLLKQHSESFKIWSAIIRIDNEGKSLIVKLGPRHTHNLREKIKHSSDTNFKNGYIESDTKEVECTGPPTRRHTE